MNVRAFILCASMVGLSTGHSDEAGGVEVRESYYPERNLKIRSTYRGKQRILYELEDERGKGRSYILNGRIVATEVDEDKDDFYEGFAIWSNDGEEFEMFLRSTNGTVRPVPTEKIKEIKAKKEEADKVLAEALRQLAAKEGHRETNSVEQPQKEARRVDRGSRRGGKRDGR